MMYELEISAQAHGPAAIDAEDAVLAILRGQYAIDHDRWKVTVRTQPVTSEDGTIIRWVSDAYARVSERR